MHVKMEICPTCPTCRFGRWDSFFPTAAGLSHLSHLSHQENRIRERKSVFRKLRFFNLALTHLSLSASRFEKKHHSLMRIPFFRWDRWDRWDIVDFTEVFRWDTCPTSQGQVGQVSKEFSCCVCAASKG